MAGIHTGMIPGMVEVIGALVGAEVTVGILTTAGADTMGGAILIMDTTHCMAHMPDLCLRLKRNEEWNLATVQFMMVLETAFHAALRS